MTIDEIGFDSESKNYLELTLEELQGAYKKLALQFGIQSTVNRNLNIELSQLRMWAAGEGISTTAIKQIRQEVLTSYLQRLKPFKRRRGRPTPFQDKDFAAELWRLYALREDKNLQFKTWLREQVEVEYVNCGKNLTTNKTEITRIVQKHATRNTRYKKSVT